MSKNRIIVYFIGIKCINFYFSFNGCAAGNLMGLSTNEGMNLSCSPYSIGWMRSVFCFLWVVFDFGFVWFFVLFNSCVVN